MDWTINGKTLTFSRGNKIDFPLEIMNVVEVSVVIVVVLDVPKGKTMTENVFGVSQNGEIVWQVERTPATSANPLNSYDIIAAGKDTIRLASWNDVTIDVDVRDGKIVNKFFTR